MNSAIKQSPCQRLNGWISHSETLTPSRMCQAHMVPAMVPFKHRHKRNVMRYANAYGEYCLLKHQRRTASCGPPREPQMRVMAGLPGVPKVDSAILPIRTSLLTRYHLGRGNTLSSQNIVMGKPSRVPHFPDGVLYQSRSSTRPSTRARHRYRQLCSL